MKIYKTDNELDNETRKLLKGKNYTLPIGIYEDKKKKLILVTLTPVVYASKEYLQKQKELYDYIKKYTKT